MLQRDLGYVETPARYFKETALAISYDMSAIDNRAKNVAKQFLDRVAESQDSDAFGYPVGDHFEWITWNQAGDLIKKYAAGLLALTIVATTAWTPRLT